MGRQLTDSRFRLAEHQRQAYRATLAVGTTIAELRDVDFWRLLSAKIQPGDTIEASWEDGSGWLLLYVRAAPGGGRLVVEPVAGRMFEDEDEDAPRLPLVAGADQADVQDGIRVEYVGGHDLWRVVLENGGALIKSGLGSRGEARRQRTNYLKSLSQRAA